MPSGRNSGQPTWVSLRVASGLTTRRRRPAGGGDAPDRVGSDAVEEDHAFGAPGAVGPGRGVADLLRRTAGDVDLLELPVGEEAEEPAVGRPERPRWSLRFPRAAGPASAFRGRTQICVLRPVESVALKARMRPSGRDLRRVERGDLRRRGDLEADDPRRLRRALRRTRTRDAAATRAVSAATAHASFSRFLRRATTGAGSPACEPPSAIHSSCSFASCAVWNRSSGSFARHVLHDPVERRRHHREPPPRSTADRRAGSSRSTTPGSCPRTPSCPVAIS